MTETTNAIRYYSTNARVPEVSLAEALLEGQAADRGLYLPTCFPTLTADDFRAMGNMTYAQIAFAVLRHFTTGMIDDEKLRALCDDAYDFDVPLEHVAGRRYLLRLDRGPTASFKDFAARMMARWMSVLVKERDGDLVILTATSGDTGSAVAHAYHKIDRIRVVVLFPIKEVSDRQRRQMTTLGDNVTTIGIEGQFDDCQAMVKQAFSDKLLADIRLSSANSINIGRLLPQTVYYVYAYAKLADHDGREQMIVSVPSGNFGNMMGCCIARRMGLPVKRLVIATNANDEVPAFIRSGQYERISPSRVCISNAMNVGHPSNLTRLVDLYGGWMNETGKLIRPLDMAWLHSDLYAVSISDDETRATITNAHREFGVMLEPHGAVGWAGLERYLQDTAGAADTLAVSVETAHPAKFPDEIQAALGIVPDLPPSLAGLEDRTEDYAVMPAEYEPFRDLLLKRFAK